MADDELARTATAPATSAEGRVAIGAQLGRYRIEQELGSGGMGVVYAAFDPDLERRIALKVLRIADTGEARHRLLREARAMARLRHPNIVVVYEVGSADGLDFVAMELLEAGSLADWLKDSTRAPSEILDAFIAAGRGLAAAHAAGIVHRDFKPHNIVRGRDGRILVTDFGLARDATNPLETTLPVGATQSGQTSLSGITMTGAVVGTPAYMAPEQWQGGRVGQPDVAVDALVQQFGVVDSHHLAAVHVDDLLVEQVALQQQQPLRRGVGRPIRLGGAHFQRLRVGAAQPVGRDNTIAVAGPHHQQRNMRAIFLRRDGDLAHPPSDGAGGVLHRPSEQLGEREGLHNRRIPRPAGRLLRQSGTRVASGQ